MLVFTRKRDEAIIIGDGVEIRVLRTGKDAVRIGVTAPSDVPVHRREVYDVVVQANRAAASVPVPALAQLAERLRVTPPPDRVE